MEKKCFKQRRLHVQRPGNESKGGKSFCKAHLGTLRHLVYVSACNWVETGPFLSFPGSSVTKETACSGGDPCSISGSERSPGEGNGNPL